MVTKYSGSFDGPIKAREEDPAMIAARRNKLNSMRTQSGISTAEQKFRAPVGRGATFAERGIARSAGPVGPNYSWNKNNRSPGSDQELITPDQAKKMGIGWKARMARNLKVLEGRNQRANTALTGRNQLANTALSGVNQLNNARQIGRNQLANTGLSNKGNLAETKLNNQGRANVAGIKERGASSRSSSAIRSAEGIAERKLAEEIRQSEQERYDNYMANATSPEQVEPRTIEEASKEYGYYNDVQQRGPKLAGRSRANEEVAEAEKMIPNMTPEQRIQYIATLSPEAQAHYAAVQEDQNARAAYQQRVPVGRKVIGGVTDAKPDPLLQLRDMARTFVNRVR